MDIKDKTSLQKGHNHSPLNASQISHRSCF